jgi:hypothetical protein
MLTAQLYVSSILSHKVGDLIFSLTERSHFTFFHVFGRSPLYFLELPLFYNALSTQSRQLFELPLLYLLAGVATFPL